MYVNGVAVADFSTLWTSLFDGFRVREAAKRKWLSGAETLVSDLNLSVIAYCLRLAQLVQTVGHTGDHSEKHFRSAGATVNNAVSK